MNAIDDGRCRSADEFVQFVDACLRHLSLEQAAYGRAGAVDIRILAESIAHRWACAGSPETAPSADAIAGLLRSDWVVSGEFRSLRSTIQSCPAE